MHEQPHKKAGQRVRLDKPRDEKHAGKPIDQSVFVPGDAVMVIDWWDRTEGSGGRSPFQEQEDQEQEEENELTVQYITRLNAFLKWVGHKNQDEVSRLIRSPEVLLVIADDGNRYLVHELELDLEPTERLLVTEAEGDDFTNAIKSGMAVLKRADIKTRQELMAFIAANRADKAAINEVEDLLQGSAVAVCGIARKISGEGLKSGAELVESHVGFTPDKAGGVRLYAVVEGKVLDMSDECQHRAIEVFKMIAGFMENSGCAVDEYQMARFIYPEKDDMINKPDETKARQVSAAHVVIRAFIAMAKISEEIAVAALGDQYKGALVK